MASDRMFRCKEVLKVVFCKVIVFTLLLEYTFFNMATGGVCVVQVVVCILPGIKSVLSVRLICFDFDVNIITLLYIYISD